MKLTKIYCGLDTNGHNVDAHKLALRLAAEWFPNGHTVYEANGRWNGEVGVINEPTIVIEVMCGQDEVEREAHHFAVQCFAGDYKKFAYQENVLITSQEVDAWFV